MAGKPTDMNGFFYTYVLLCAHATLESRSTANRQGATAPSIQIAPRPPFSDDGRSGAYAGPPEEDAPIGAASPHLQMA